MSMLFFFAFVLCAPVEVTDRAHIFFSLRMTMMISAPSSSFHDCLAMDGLLPKPESLSPSEFCEEQFEPSLNEETNHARSVIVKRPMNAFLLWARGERKRVSSDGYGVSQTSLSKLLGESWRQMTIEEKQPFLDMAEALKRQHHLDHPDYRFKPKQRSTTGNKAIAKKQQTPMPQQAFSSMICSPGSSSSSSSSSHSHCSQTTSNSSPMSTATPHPIQSSVLAMCHAMLPSTSNPPDDWFGKLTEQPQPVIVAPFPRSQPSPQSSRRAVRIQIINKHDDIAISASTSLPMTPSPQASSRLSSFPVDVDESTPTLADYLACTNNLFHPVDDQQGLAAVMETSMGYETFHESSSNHFTDLDQQSDHSGWIDTPLSNFGTNSTDLLPSPYASYDFLCL